eukprot:3430596-Pleurochrysis_carterae.AAC.2
MLAHPLSEAQRDESSARRDLALLEKGAERRVRGVVPVCAWVSAALVHRAAAAHFSHGRQLVKIAAHNQLQRRAAWKPIPRPANVANRCPVPVEEFGVHHAYLVDHERI